MNAPERIFDPSPWTSPASYAGAAEDDRPNLVSRLARSDRAGAAAPRLPGRRPFAFFSPDMPWSHLAICCVVAAIVGALLAMGGF